MKNIKWDTIISLLALMVSLSAFFFSFQVERSKSSPNIQVVSVHGGRTRESGNVLDNVNISSTIVLTNVGNAPTQIIDVSWEIATSAKTNLDGLLAISDTQDPSSLEYKEYFESIRYSPVQGIQQTTIEPHKTLTLELFFRSDPIPKDDTTVQNIRVVFTFSNGQQLIILPELKYFGGSIKF
ncbi:MAG: hypothetical protein QY306_08560 [Anaerolineales bacterium]|nr:MAG: hypothetical protein QY306_08560 [Anaerolineales bacterium]